MLAFSSVWIALASLLLAVAMLVYRPTMTDLNLTLVLYFGSPGAICFAGLTLWAFRKDDSSDPGVAARRTQSKVAIFMALLAAAIVYALVIRADRIEPIAPPHVI